VTFWFLIPSVQHELGLAADDGVRQLVELTEGQVSPADKAAAMKAAIEKKAVALRNKMGKLVAVSNPELTDGWLREVGALYHCPYYFIQFILGKMTEQLTSPVSHRLNDITP
jgi:hypothetical protein